MFSATRILSLSLATITVLSLCGTAQAKSGCCSGHGGVCGCQCCDKTALSTKCAPFYPSCSNERSQASSVSSRSIYVPPSLVPLVTKPKAAAQSSIAIGSSCTVRGALPDATCTPGAVFQSATKAIICVSGYTMTVRDVPQSLKNKVFSEYGITTHNGSTYEVDHLIPLEIGGSNDIKNLWPEAANPTPGFHDKDKLENYLHKVVCNGSMSLSEAQKEISMDWLTTYKNLLGSGTK
jgi:hypothetical protein